MRLSNYLTARELWSQPVERQVVPTKISVRTNPRESSHFRPVRGDILETADVAAFKRHKFM